VDGRTADIHIKHRPGTDNYLINAMMNHLIAAGLHQRAVRPAAVRELRRVPQES